MMTIGGLPHILMIIASVLIGTGLFFLVKYSKEKTQNIIIYTLTFVCVFGIFFLHATNYFRKFDIAKLMIEMLQVCNFNFILLPLCLFKRNELARQYLFFFSMPMALSTFVSYPGDIEGSMWYSVECLTFWVNHFLIALIPILMVATRRFKPRKEYVWKVVVCIFAYFLIAFIGNYILNGFSITGPHNHSYTMDGGSIMILQPIFEIIPVPFVYLWPILPVLYLIYIGVAKLFHKYNTKDNFGFVIKNNKGGEK